MECNNDGGKDSSRVYEPDPGTRVQTPAPESYLTMTPEGWTSEQNKTCKRRWRIKNNHQKPQWSGSFAPDIGPGDQSSFWGPLSAKFNQAYI